MTEKKEYLNEMLNRYGFNGNFVLNLCENKENDILNQIEKDKIARAGVDFETVRSGPHD